MNVKELQSILNENPDSAIQFLLPDGTSIPTHFHLTEVGRVQRDFIDCGGTKRSTTTCLLQTWVARDEDHRLSSTKFARILEIAEPILGSTSLPVEVEYEQKLVSQFPVVSAEVSGSGVVFRLGLKHTDCLARESCDAKDPNSRAEAQCCTTSGCCS